MRGGLLAIYIFLTLSKLVTAQVVTEDVDFDYYVNGLNCDLSNNFSNVNGLIQIPTNGITGGCVHTPDSISWGNDLAVYCSSFHHYTGDTLKTSICFKFNTFNIQAGSFQRAVSLWLQPSADFNHYIIGTINYNQKMELITYGWSNNGGPTVTLLNNHWYRYELEAVMLGGVNNQVAVNAYIYDLGFFGLTVPTLVNSTGGTFSDNILIADTMIRVAMSGTAYGGATQLDDFQFHGRKGVSNCSSIVSLNENFGRSGFSVSPNPADDYIWINMDPFTEKESFMFNIYNNAGQLIMQKANTELQQIIEVQNLIAGIYFLQLIKDSRVYTEKLVISH